MRSLIAFLKKDLTEQIRSGRLMITAIAFVVLGIMNPAVAKLTPWLLEIMADQLAQTGMTVTEVTVSAMDSWVQFFKNVPMGFIAFILLHSSILTGEYASGTLVLSLTKGLERYKVVISKSVVLTALWTVFYFVCFGITYGYNAYFWDNSVAQSLMLSVVYWWLFGMWTISLTVFFSTLSRSNTGVLVATGGVVLGCYLAGMIPKVEKLLPTRLTDGTSLIYGMAEPREYLAATVITALTCVVLFIVSIPIFDKKQL